jgi:hypothetical protein
VGRVPRVAEEDRRPWPRARLRPAPEAAITPGRPRRTRNGMGEKRAGLGGMAVGGWRALRQGYGRAGFARLRQRVLQAA